MDNYRSFEELELACWKEARSLRLFVSNAIISKLTSSAKYVLIDQIKRSSRSVGNNIAEGYGRFHYQETYNFAELQEVHYLKL